jgi:predicted acylesterase/phospholipase RssA
MCATLADKGESILLRNYDPPFPALPVSTGAGDLICNAITIKEAARATSAAPTYLKQATIQGLDFWDGGLLNNNPILQAWDNRDDLVDRDTASPRITCIVSLGTSHKEYNEKRRVGTGIQRFLNTITKTVAFVTNTEAKHRDFDRNIRQHNKRRPADKIGYFRFNASTGDDNIDLGDYLKMPKLVEYTNDYLKKADVDKSIDECAALLADTS